MAVDWGLVTSSAFSTLGGLNEGSAPPAISSSDSGAVTVNVGGLNVPPYPNFPRLNNETTGQTLHTPIASQLAADNKPYLLAGGILLAAILIKSLKT